MVGVLVGVALLLGQHVVALTYNHRMDDTGVEAAVGEDGSLPPTRSPSHSPRLGVDYLWPGVGSDGFETHDVGVKWPKSPTLVSGSGVSLPLDHLPNNLVRADGSPSRASSVPPSPASSSNSDWSPSQVQHHVDQALRVDRAGGAGAEPAAGRAVVEDVEERGRAGRMARCRGKLPHWPWYEKGFSFPYERKTFREVSNDNCQCEERKSEMSGRIVASSSLCGSIADGGI